MMLDPAWLLIAASPRYRSRHSNASIGSITSQTIV